MIIRKVSYPRAALIGNPSDGYYGKTIAFLFSNFKAEILLYESPELELIPGESDGSIFKSMTSMVEEVKHSGYYGGIRLLKASIKRFHEHCEVNNHMLDNRNFTIQYSSDIPYRLGLAGSSAIITATIKALMEFYDVNIKKEYLANLVLSVEQDELSISAGLQDRVTQAFECPVYMDFDENQMKTKAYGIYKTINTDKFPLLYIAYQRELSEGSEIVHNSFRERFKLKENSVIEAIEQWKDLTDEVYEMLVSGNLNGIDEKINANFNLRKSVMNISSKNLEMVEIARKTGASAKFTGSGGAIIGTYQDEVVYDELKTRLNDIGVEIIKPNIVRQ